ncbi:thioesterase family protein [Psychrobacter alimentarius]|uniref:thioesterase family protein n=1 Tax=Psychrobacter alimentarius TaxID=261164 RepID=UPI003FD02240
MSEKKLDVDDDFLAFETVMRVRHAEADANQYLTLESLTALLTESWLRFLYAKGIKEVNADYQGLIIDELQLNIRSRVKVREELLFEVGIKPSYDNGGHVEIKVTRMHTGELVAHSRQHFVNYDFRLNKVTALDSTIKRALYPRSCKH